MRTFTGSVALFGHVGCRQVVHFLVPDDATPEEIAGHAHAALLEAVIWHYEEDGPPPQETPDA